MTPEEAKPRDGYAVEYSDASEKWFTAKETAEIAKAYGRACLHSYMDKAAKTVDKFEDLFKEWSK